MQERVAAAAAGILRPLRNANRIASGNFNQLPICHFDEGDIVVCAYMEWLCDLFPFLLCGAGVWILAAALRSKSSD